MTLPARALALYLLLPHAVLAAGPPTTFRAATGQDVVDQLTRSQTVLPATALPIGTAPGTVAGGPALAAEISRAVQAEAVASAAIAAINAGALAGVALANGHLVLTKLNGQTVDIGPLSASSGSAQTLAAVATSGSYADLTGKPTIPAAAVAGTTPGTFAAGNDSRIVGAAQVASLATVATSGSYSDLSNKPAIPPAYTLPAASGAILGGIKTGPTLVTNSGTGLTDVAFPALVTPPAGFTLASSDIVQVTRGTGSSAVVYAVPFSQFIASSGSSSAAGPATTTSDSTLAGIPSSTVAGQPLTSTTVAANASSYFVLWNVAAGAEDGGRFVAGAMNNTLFLLTPQNAGAYTVRGYDAASAGNKVYESVQFNVTAAPGPLPPAPTSAASTNATASSVTFNWTASTGATAYRFLARAGLGAAYGSLAGVTVSGTSYNLTGLAANSTPRAVVVPQNANGFGPASSQFIAFTAAN